MLSMDETQVLAGGTHVGQAHAMEWIAQADTQNAVSVRTPLSLIRFLEKNQHPHGPAHVALGNNRDFVLQRAKDCRRVWEKRKAPLLKNGVFSGETRIYALMAQLVIRQRGNVRKKDVDAVLARYAAYGALTLDEASLVHAAVDLALLEFLRQALQEDEKEEQEQKTARLFARKLQGRHAASWLQTALFYARHGGIAFAAFLQEEAKRCPPHVYTQACDNTALPLGTSARRVRDLFTHTRRERAELVRDIVRSLQHMACQETADWMRLASPAAAMLAQDPDFTRQDEQTKARVYAAVSALARRSGYTEQTVVQTARSLCQRNGACLYSIFLCKERRFLYERFHLRFRPHPIQWHKWLYLMGTIGLWAVSLGVFLFLCLYNQAPWLETLGLCAFGSLMVWTMAQMCANRWISVGHPAAFVPKLGKMPPQARTVVVLSVVIEREEQIDACFAALERQYCAFRQAERMILLCDLPPTNTKDNSVFIPWLDHGVQTVQRYNAKGNGRYTFAVRPQRWVKGEGKWMGWDRKRGALLALNRELLGRRNELWCYGQPLPEQVRYVLTMDTDTFLPAGEAERLVCTLAHPANARYAIAQPRTTVAAASRRRSWFARLYAGRPMDGYAEADSQVWMRLTGYGPFTGQGLYDVAAFTKAVEGIPANRFLSYALLEGALAGCVVAGDVWAVREFPLHYTSYAKQQHRLIRGDWQLLPCVVGAQKNVCGTKLRLPWYARLQMIDRMRLSLTALMATQLFAIGASFSRLPFGLYLLLAFGPFVLPFVLDIGEGFLQWAKRTPQKRTEERAAFSAMRAVADFLLCAFEADIQLDAAVRGSIRTWLTHKHLMQWVTTGQAEKGDARTWVGYVRLMAPALVFDMLVIGFTYLQKPWLLWPTIAICFGWTLSPLFANALDKRPRRPIAANRVENSAALVRDAERYFACFGGPQRQFLPPAAVERRPGCGTKTAPYATPDALGMALLAPLCAERLGDLDRVLALHRITRQMDAIERLPRYDGHLPERIPLVGCAMMEAPAISTAASGCLCACLMICAQALTDWGETALATRMQTFARKMDFRVLYDETRGRFAAGLDVQTGKWAQAPVDERAFPMDLAGLIAVGRGEAPAGYFYRMASPAQPHVGEQIQTAFFAVQPHARKGNKARTQDEWEDVGCTAYGQGALLIAVVDAQCQGCISRWFLRNPEIAAAIPFFRQDVWLPIPHTDACWTESLPKNERIPRYQLKKKEMYNIITH